MSIYVSVSQSQVNLYFFSCQIYTQILLAHLFIWKGTKLVPETNSLKELF